jgi:cytochrome c-type biogenesis protein CcmH
VRRLLAVLILVFALGLFAGSAAAQGSGPTDDEVNAIAKNLYCPVCENVPLDVCPTVACQQWRQQIADKLAAGWSEQQIYDYFVEQYGDRVLAAPPARGLNWLVYVLPPLAIALGALVVARVLRTWRARSLETVEGIQPDGDDYVQQLERELESRR